MKDTLNHLSLDTTAKIEKLDCTGSVRRRLLDLGLIKSTKITPILKSPSRRPNCL